MDGTITKIDGATNIKIRDKNGVFSVKREADIRTMLNQGNAEPYRQPVMIRTNSFGQVNEIYMLANSDRLDLTFHAIPYNNVGGSGKRWYQPAYTFHSVIQLTPDTKVVAVPHSTRISVELDEFFISTYRLFKGTVYYPESGDNGYFQIPIGMEKGAIAADYLVWEYPENGEYRSNYLASTQRGIVTKISQVIDDNEDKYIKITYCSMTGLFGNTMLYKNTDGSLDFVDNVGRKVNVGDIISIGQDYFGYATESSIKTFYDSQNDLIINEGDTSSPAFYAWHLAKGVIDEINDGYIKVTITRTNGSNTYRILDLAGAVTINCDLKNNTFIKDRAPASLLSKGDSFFLAISGGLPSTLLIYK